MIIYVGFIISIIVIIIIINPELLVTVMHLSLWIQAATFSSVI